MTMRNMIHNCIKLLIWIPVLVTGILITSFSAQNGTQSSGLSRKVAQTFIQELENVHVISVESNDQREVLIEKMQYPIRKGAHMTEYAIFTVFTYIALLTDGVRLPKRRYSALLTAVLLASSDELHQWFVPGRSGCVKDVCIDTVGAVAALLVIWAGDGESLHQSSVRRRVPDWKGNHERDDCHGGQSIFYFAGQPFLDPTLKTANYNRLSPGL